MVTCQICQSCRKDNPKYKNNDVVIRTNVPFTQMGMLKKSLPYPVQKLLASRSGKDEIFFNYTEFTKKVTPISRKRRDLTLQRRRMIRPLRGIPTGTTPRNLVLPRRRIIINRFDSCRNSKLSNRKTGRICIKNKPPV